MKRLVTAIGIAGLGVVITGGFFYGHSTGSTPRYRTAQVERGGLTAAVSASGAVNPVVTVQVGSQLSGQVKEIYVDYNAAVLRGQKIALIAPELFESKVNQARADVQNAQAAVLTQRALVQRARADVENARWTLAGAQAQSAKAQVAVVDAQRDLERKRELLGKNLIARSDRDTAQALYDSALAQAESARAQERVLAAGIRAAEAQVEAVQAQLQSAIATVQQRQAALAQARVDLDNTVIRAPVAGIVVSRSVDVGQTVAASLQAPTLFTIAQDLSRMQVETNILEGDIGRLQVGQHATFTVDAFPGKTFQGEVVQIRRAPQVNQGVVSYNVVVSARNPELKLLPGMTANVRVVTAEKADVLKVPNAALRVRLGASDGDAERTTRPDGPAGDRSGGRAEGTGDEKWERLAKDLGLGADQRGALERIVRDRREKLEALPVGEELSKAERAGRRARRQVVREDADRRIRELLTADQRARYDQWAAERPAGRDGAAGGVPGRVHVLAPGGGTRPVTVQIGISDGSATEVLAGDLREGQEIVIGLADRRPSRAGQRGAQAKF
jgi:HlyD family secretion protein